MNLVKSSSKLLLFFILLCFVSNTEAQFKDYKIKGGLQWNGLYPTGEFMDNPLKYSYIFRAFARYELSPLFDLEGGVGYGSYAGTDNGKIEYYSDGTSFTFGPNYWRTQIIPFDARLLVTPFDHEKINPYGYAGVGALYFKNTDKPITTAPPATQEDGWAIVVPFGVGMEYALTPNILIDVALGYGYVFRDDLNYHDNTFISGEGNDDGWINLAAGVMYAPFSDSDKDKDGLSNSDEDDLGTDPENPDTDGDGLLDGEEVMNYDTDPLKADSDDDGLEDGAEVNQYKTDPNLPDTDGDGLSDGDEVNEYYTDPLNTDSDGDSLTDGNEVNTHGTNPNKADSDSDGLDDAKELSLQTNPTNKDTDGDGLSDGEEVNTHNTDPKKADTDDGSIDDLREITRGSDPLNPEDDIEVQERDAEITLEGVNFDSGSYDVSPNAATILENGILTQMRAVPNMRVEIIGYTDNVGSETSNQILSQRRAEAVVQWLISQGIAPNRLVAIGRGEANPIASNATPQGKAQNRRITAHRID